MENNKDIGNILRNLRLSHNETLLKVTISTNIDTTILSKIERGDRLPTIEQLSKLANHFEIPLNDLTSKFIAQKIIMDYGINGNTLEALNLVKEKIIEYNKEIKNE